MRKIVEKYGKNTETRGKNAEKRAKNYGKLWEKITRKMGLI